MSFENFPLNWVLPPGLYVLALLVLWTIKKILFRLIRRFAARTAFRFDDILLDALDRPLGILVFCGAAVLVQQILPATQTAQLTAILTGIFKAGMVVAMILFADRFLVLLIRQYTDRLDILKTTGGIVQGVVRGIVIVLGILILLDSFGVSISPILASLGIGSLAVALAIQPTLENLFSGIQIVIDKPFQEGHLIRLESGEEGHVYKITWRATWIRLAPNNMVILPNKMLVNSRIINFQYPSLEVMVDVMNTVHYSSDLEKVERVTLEVATQAQQQSPHAVATFSPGLTYREFGDSGILYVVKLQAKSMDGAGRLKHDFIKRLHHRYAQEGIVMPYPTRAINYEQEKVASGSQKS